MLLLIGLLVGRISLLFDDALARGDYLLIAYLVPLFTKMLWWPRDSFASIPRPFVWGFLFVWGMSGLLLKQNNPENSEQLQVQGDNNSL